MLAGILDGEIAVWKRHRRRIAKFEAAVKLTTRWLRRNEPNVFRSPLLGARSSNERFPDAEKVYREEYRTASEQGGRAWMKQG